MQKSSKRTLHQHWLHFYCWQIQNGYLILIIHQQLAEGCKLQVWVCFFGGGRRGAGFGFFFVWLVFNRATQKKTHTAMPALHIRPPTSEAGNGSPTNSLFEKSKLKCFREGIPNQWYQSTQSSLHRLSISNRQDNITLGKTTPVCILTFTCFLKILQPQNSQHITAYMKELDGSVPSIQFLKLFS